MMRHALALAALLVIAVGCGGKSDEPVQASSASDVPEEQGGVGVRIIRKGYGRAAEAGDLLTVHTTGWLYDDAAPEHRGDKFWSSLDSGEKLTFTLGAGQMIRGWDQGLPGMLIGEVRELTIPPDLGYGATGRGPIPPDSTLVFEVELFGAQSPEEAATPAD